MEATKPSTFAVIFSYTLDLSAFACENAIGEQLCGMRTQNPASFAKRYIMCMRNDDGHEFKGKFAMYFKNNL